MNCLSDTCIDLADGPSHVSEGDPFGGQSNGQAKEIVERGILE